MDKILESKILALLDDHRIMTVATLRPDGWPQATTVGYVNRAMAVYFLCALDSQKAANLARDDRVSLTINGDASDLLAITGLSMAGHAERSMIGPRPRRPWPCCRRSIPTRPDPCPSRCRRPTLSRSSGSYPR